jgi:hypothetical protein
MNFIMEIKGMAALSYSRPDTVIKRKKYRYVGVVCQPVFAPQIRSVKEDAFQHSVSMRIKRKHIDSDLVVSWYDV